MAARKPRPKHRYVYFAHDGEPTKYVKIGISINPPGRLAELKCKLLFAVLCDYDFARKLERRLHDRFASCRITRHDIRGYGNTEWFRLDDPHLTALIQFCRLRKQWPWDASAKVIL